MIPRRSVKALLVTVSLTLLAGGSDLIERVSFLRGASRELIHELCSKLEPVVFAPRDIIVRSGEYGRHIYFIRSGSVDVLKKDGQTLIRTLSEGDFFGELALLHAQPRTATIRAVGYCDLYSLDREIFTRTLVRYPDFAAHIERVSEERTVPEDAASGQDV